MSEYILRNETLHSINCVDLEHSLLPDVTVDTLPRAVEEAALRVGEAYHNGVPVPVDVVVYGGHINLAPPEDGVFRIVSALTVERAKRYNRPIHDLLVPFGYDPQKNQALGLASLNPTPHRSAPPRFIPAQTFKSIETALPYPGKIFTPETFDFVEPDQETLITINACDPSDVMSVRYQENEISDELSAKLGVTVFNVGEPHISYSPEQCIDDSLLIVEPKVAFAGLNLFAGSTIQAAMIGQDVRASSGPRKHGILGGRRLIVPYALQYKV